MGRIDLGRVLIGGVVAGIIIDIFEFVLNGWFLAGQWSDVMASLNRAPVGTSEIIAFNIIGLVTGIAVVWTYAAIRPRFGIGPGTAFIAALLTWIVGYVLADAPPAIMGIFPLKMVCIMIAVGLVEIVAATMAGAWLYREGE
ncbi:MAG TPA: hypothetical protein VGI20_05590 [Rhizomicrobium sp.]|jgi:hypothetical protein